MADDAPPAPARITDTLRLAEKIAVDITLSGLPREKQQTALRIAAELLDLPEEVDPLTGRSC